MSTYTQTDRSLSVATPLGEDVLLLEAVSGEEAVSEPYRLTLEMLSTNADIAPGELLGKPVAVSLELPDGGARRLHGVVSHFTQFGTVEGLTSYQAEVVPWLWLLSLSSDSRIFQNLTVPEIVAKVFEGLGHRDFALRLYKTYPKREFCVQYRETHLNFVSRLLEEEGIFYFFEHEAERHVLVLADLPAAVQPCPGLRAVRMAARGAAWQDDDVVTALRREHAVQSGKVTLNDYNWLTPSLQLQASADGSEPFGEVFQHPGSYAEREDGYRYARLRLETLEAARQTVSGTSTVRALTSGHSFELAGHYRRDANRAYHLLRVRHAARQGGYRAGEGAELDYTNEFVAVPSDAPYHPPRRAESPRAYGTQSALVVGPGGEEIHTDAHGRVKLHFFWDRESQRNETSSCWVRASTAWAGKGWGQFSVPRIGQEVLVEFMEGNPDRPVIVGRVYNAEMPPPCDPGGSGGAVSGMRSKSHKGAGGNWMEMHDAAGKEKIDIHAQYDMVTVVEHDDTQTVKTGNRKIDVLAGTHTETIKGNTTVTIVSGAHKLDVQTGTHTHHVKANVIENYDADQTTTVAHNVRVDAGDKITLHTGDSTLTLESNGKVTLHCKNLEIIGDVSIKASAPKIEVLGGDEAKMGVGNQQVTCDKAKVNVSGAAINASAVGTHEITGALVKIN